MTEAEKTPAWMEKPWEIWHDGQWEMRFFMDR